MTSKVNKGWVFDMEAKTFTLKLSIAWTMWLRNLTICFFLIFWWKQYLKQFPAKQLPVLERFSLLLTIEVIWAFGHLLTASGAYKHHPEQTQMHCGTDKASFISAAPWIKIPYPLQWSVTSFEAGHAFGMIAAVLVSLVESTVASKATARLASATPCSCTSRDIGWQGIGILLSGPQLVQQSLCKFFFLLTVYIV
uniref:nucleobase-ascorbate transporter 2-like n=1 Tax=Erigeron canadensis TaxID=72917 RepID=UPI001CB8CF42|nr:nucleobase-ascorbate transporter 2-like [Erigeron canadensis]